MMVLPLRALMALAVLALALPQAASAAWMDRTDAIMGTRIYVELWADDPAKGERGIDAVMAEMRRIDDLMSHYKPESQLSQINQRADSEPVQVDKELFDLIKLSTHYSADHRRGVRHHVRERWLSLRLSAITFVRPRRNQAGPTGSELAQHAPR